METNRFAPIAAFKSPFAKLNHHEKLRNKIGAGSPNQQTTRWLSNGDTALWQAISNFGLHAQIHTASLIAPLSWGRTIPDQADQADQAFLISLALHALRWIRQDDGKGIRMPTAQGIKLQRMP